MAPVADRTEGANIGSLTDGSVGRARRGHKKAGGEEGGRRRRRRGRGAGPVSARWRARPRNFSVVFRGPWSSGPEMKAEPPLNAAAGLRSKIPLPPNPNIPKRKTFVCICMHHVAPQLHVTFRRLVPPAPRPDTRDTRDFLLFFFFFYFRPPPTTSSSTLSLSLSSSFPFPLSLSRADFVEFVSSPLPPQSSYLLLAACSLFIFYSSLRVFSSAAFPWWTWFRGKAGPRRSAPSSLPVHADRSASVARLPAARDHARSPGRSGALSARLEAVAYASVRLCRPPPPPSSSSPARTSSRHRFDASTDRCANGSR